MAVDTRDKRSSAIGVLLPWRLQFPTPDGSDADTDLQRAQMAWQYAGIALSPDLGDELQVGDSAVDAVRVGDSAVSGVYVGDTLVWSP